METAVAPAPSTAPAPAPAASPSAAPVDIKTSPFAGLDSKIKAPAPEKTVDKAPDKAPDKVLSDTTKDDAVGKPPKWYREQQEKFTAEAKVYNEKVKTLETRLAEAEKRGQDTTALTERLAALERERDDALAGLRAAKKEVSPDFIAKWDEPFNQAAAYAESVISRLSVGKIMDDPETGTPKWTPQRKADFGKDFVRLYQLHKEDPGAALEEAEAIFGRASQIAITHINELERLDRAKHTALEKEKATWKERDTTEQAEKVRQNEAYNSMRGYVDKALVDANPDFRDAPGDEGKESKALRDEGYAIFDAKPRTLQEAALKSAEVKHRVAAFGPMQRQRDQLLQENKQLKATIQEMKGAGPGKTVRTSETAGAPEKSWMDDVRESVTANMS